MNTEFPDMRAVTYQQSAETEITTILLPKSVLLYIEEGRKSVSSPDKETQTAESGEFVFIQSNIEITVRNCPRPGGRFVAQGLAFDRHESAEPIVVQERTEKDFHCFSGPGEMIEAFTRLRAAIRQPELPEQVVQARFFELQAWLTRLDIFLFPRQSHTLVTKLRALLASDLSYSWRGADVAAQLGMSEATLRRALAREGTNFTLVLRETRLQVALERLQTTEQSLSEIAYSTGFSSHSHFTDVFRKRFEFPPSHLRGRGEAQMIGI